MTDNRPTTSGVHPRALVHEKGGGPTMFVVAVTDAAQGRFAHVVWKDEMGEEACATFRAEDLAVVVPYTAEGDR